MASIDDLLAVDLSLRHVGDAMELVQEAGWNQCARDWQMMMAAGTGFGYEDSTGKLVASALVLPCGARVGWIGMVLVTATHQRRGLATRLIERAIRWLEDADLTPCLDATPAGEQVYLKHGFVPQFSYHRWHREGPATSTASVAPLTKSDILTAQGLDLSAFGADRSALIADVAQRGAPCEVSNDGTGFALSRAGRVGHQIGPIVAQNEKTAINLFDQLQASLNAPIFIDIPDDHTAMADHVRAAGFTCQRPFKRMVRGDLNLNGPEAMFALFGPELG